MLQNKLLSKEINVFQKKETELNELLESKNKKIKELQNLLQQTNWELSDMSSSKNTRILELEAQVYVVCVKNKVIVFNVFLSCFFDLIWKLAAED